MPPTLDPRVDAYIAQQEPFARPILEKIRAAFHAGCPDLVENIKWGVPSFERTKLIGGMAAFKAHVSYGFWRAADMEDPHGLLGEVRKASPMRIRATTTRDLPSKKVLVEYVRDAARLDAEGAPKKKPAQNQKPSARAPRDLAAALAKAPRAKAFWDTLAPGYKRDYVEWITDAKRDATREKRLATTIEWLAEKKRRNWKYESC